MKVTLQSTSKIVTFDIGGASVPGRVWEGVTENGVQCHAFITRIAVSKAADASEFERDLKEHAAPSAEIQSIPLRMIL